MELVHIATGHVFELLGSVGIIASLLFAAIELQHFSKAQRITNALAFTRQHREIWQSLYEKPELKRVLDPNPDLQRQPVTIEESIFVTSLILHLKTAFKAQEAGMFQTPEALDRDIHQFFTLPIPREVWRKSKEHQDGPFTQFVETAAGITGRP